jgi:hypothetical protein
MEWALAHHDRTDPEGVVVQTWLAVDREAALAWLLEPGRIEATRTLGTSAASALFHDREAYVRFLDALLPDGLEIDVLVHSKLSQDKIPYETLRPWFSTLSSKYREQLLPIFLYRLPDARQQIAMLHDFADDTSANRYASVFSEWAKTDRTAAFAALDALDSGKEQTAAWQGILRHMLDNGDIPAAVEEMHLHPERLDDIFLSINALNAASFDPVKSLEINSMVKDPRKRDTFYVMGVMRWRVPPDGPVREALEQWIATHDEPVSVRKKLEQK